MEKNPILAREISWLSFNARVLQEANDPTVPLKERVRFLGIFSNNRDEFFRKRMAPLKRLIQSNVKKVKSNIGDHPEQIFDQIHGIVLKQQDEFNRIWKNVIAELKKSKIFLRDNTQLNANQKDFVVDYYDNEVSSLIIPLFIESMPQLPAFGDENIFLGILMKKNSNSPDKKLALIEIPTQNLSRFVALPSLPGHQNFMLLEDLIRFNLPRIFSHLGYTHFEAHMFKVTKDAEIDIDNDLSTTFIQKIEKGVKNRRKASPTNFLYEKEMNQELVEFLIHKLNLSPKDSVVPGGHIRNFRDFMEFPAVLSSSRARQRPFKHPLLTKAMRMSDAIRQHDILLHFPYHSFNSIIDLLCEAAMDPDVKSIKITAYRLAPRSKIGNALINAARSGKEVHVVLELRASFDEKANLEWKSRFEEEGIKVFVTPRQLKVHAKLGLIKKQMGHRTEYYGFVGTGNLNEKTALSYTDHYLLTADRVVMSDLNHLFAIMEDPEKNHWKPGLFKKLLVSPWNMREALLRLIEAEIQFAKAGKTAKIIINLNSLSDELLIKKLYEAKDAGVDIHMIIRGIYCMDHPISAISIVDEYLEHSRVIWFQHNGRSQIFISSADWAERNFDHRIEAAIPIRDNAIKDELKHILNIKLSDNVKARELDQEFQNRYVSSKGKKKVRSQLAIYQYLLGKKYTRNGT